MAEILLRAQIDDVRISAVIFDEAFCMKQEGDPKWALANLKAVHQHSTYEIFFVANGCLSIVTENETLNCEHSVVIIPPLVNHYTVAQELEGNCMYFTVERVAKKQGELYDGIKAQISEKVTVIPLTDDEKFYVNHIAAAIGGEMSRDSTQPLVSLLFSEIFLRISPQNAQKSISQSKRGKYINTIDIYLAEHYCENITLSDLASELYLCEKQISRIIKNGYGCSLSELVNRRRLAAACMLLKYTTMPVGEIAANVGYEYENYFFTVFKKMYGMTPMEFRESNI